MTVTHEELDNSRRTALAEQTLTAYAEAVGLNVDLSEGFSPRMVSALVAALCHYVEVEENPADVLARGLVDYDEQARAERGPVTSTFAQAGGSLIAAVLQHADMEATTDSMTTLLCGLGIYTPQD
jgi:hypothetical protein